MKYIVKYEDGSVFRSAATFGELEPWRDLPDDKAIKALYFRVPGSSDFLMLSGYQAYNVVLDVAVDMIAGTGDKSFEGCVEQVHIFGRKEDRVKRYTVALKQRNYQNLRNRSVESVWELAEYLKLVPKSFRHKKQFEVVQSNLKMIPNLAKFLVKKLGNLSQCSTIQEISPYLGLTGDEALDVDRRLVQAMIHPIIIDVAELQRELCDNADTDEMPEAILLGSIANAVDHFKDIKVSPGDIVVSNVRLGKELYGEAIMGWKAGVVYAKSK